MRPMKYDSDKAARMDTIMSWRQHKVEWALADLMSPIEYNANNA